MISISRSSKNLTVSFLERTDNGQQNTTLSSSFSTGKYEALLEIKNELNSMANFSIEKYEELTERIKQVMEENFPDIIEQVTDELVMLGDGNVYFQFSKDGQEPIIVDVPLPQPFVQWIRDCIDNEIDIQPIIKFWVRLLRNPQVVNREHADEYAKDICGYIMQTTLDPTLYKQLKEQGYTDEFAIEMATVTQTPLTEEGLIHTQKVVDVDSDKTLFKWTTKDGLPHRVLKDNIQGVKVDEETGDIGAPDYAEDWIFEPAIYKTGGDKFYCGEEKDQYIYKVGKRAMLPEWSMVSKLNTRNPGKGFWLGNLDWVRSYEKDDNVTLNCFVCPSKIGTVAHWFHEDGAIVVKEFFPHSIKNRELTNKAFYTASHYGAMLDAEWNDEKQELADKLGEEKKKIEERLAQLELI